MKRLSPLSHCAVAVLFAGTLAGCGGVGGNDSDKPSVVAAFYPFEFIAKRISGEHIDVTNLTRPGAEPHDVELQPQQAADIADADLIVYLHGFQPDIDAAVDEHNADNGFDVATVEELHTGFVPTDEHSDERTDAHDSEDNEHSELGEDAEREDPHIWQDPLRLATIGDALATRLADIDPENESDYSRGAEQLRTELTKLDEEYAHTLENCQSRTFVVSHNAFGYLADRYELTQVAISGLDPESEPSSGRLTEVTQIARQHDISVIFFEVLVSPKVAETIANNVGARTEVLDPIEGIPDGSDETYVSLMRANLRQLVAALQCE